MSAFLWLLACGAASDDIVAGLASRNPVVREEVALLARSVDDPEVVAALVTALADPSEAVRYQAIESLAELDATTAVPALVEVLEHDASDKVQRSAIEALGHLGDAEAVPGIVRYVEAREAAPPLNAIWALGALGDPRALDVLSRLLQHPDSYVSYNAAQALRHIEGA